jgi:hypothetical protein
LHYCTNKCPLSRDARATTNLFQLILKMSPAIVMLIWKIEKDNLTSPKTKKFLQLRRTSSPWPPAAGAPPPLQRAMQGTISIVAPKRGPVEGSRSPPAKEVEATARLPSADCYSCSGPSLQQLLSWRSPLACEPFSDALLSSPCFGEEKSE